MGRLLVLAVLGFLLVGCGTNHASGPTLSTGTPTGPTPGVSATPAPRVLARGAAPIQLRVVLRSSDAGRQAPSAQPTVPATWLARFASYRCDTGTFGAPSSYWLGCDAARTKYLLAPAAWSGRATSARAALPAGQVSWTVDVSLDDAGARALATLSRQLVGTGGRVAILSGAEVLSASSFEGVISDGTLQISGNFTEDSANALADSLTGHPRP